jgi:hypothetical protein
VTLCECGCPNATEEDFDMPEKEHDTIIPRDTHTHDGCHVIHKGKECPIPPEQGGLFA